jgi:hypothetical protein
LGAVIPADALYDALAPDLVNTGVLLGELANRIQEQQTDPEHGTLRRRICGLAFLISKLPREKGLDVGVRASARHIADLMVSDLTSDSYSFRNEVETQLEALAEAGTLMRVGDEYRLQTTQGAEWDRAFREQQASLGARVPELQAKQDQLLAAAVQNVVHELRPKHGDSKVPRTLSLHANPNAPEGRGEEIIVWQRDGSSASQKDVESEARRRGQEDSVLHVFLAKPGSELRSRIIEAEAARAVLDSKGMPTEPAEAREACESMQSRRLVAEAARDELIRDLVASAKVFQGGGNELYGESLRAKLETAIEASLARLFPRFHEGDHKAWAAALKRARDGSDQPLKVVGWEGATEEHPVLRQILTNIGNGAKGAELRKQLKAAPYGWPQDAIDAGLVALHTSGSLRVLQNGQPLGAGRLDQSKISTAEFRPERVRLSATDKLTLRGLYQQAGVQAKSGEEELKARAFLDAMHELARAAGGDSPLPAPPSTEKIEELRRKSGSEQLGALLDAAEELQQHLADWTARKQRAEARKPGWTRLQRLMACADPLPVMGELRPEIEAIRENRSLLDDTDYVAPLAKKLELALREALVDAHARCVDTFTASMRELEASESWQNLPPEQREAISRTHRLEPVPALDVADEARLLTALEARSLQGWAELAEGHPDPLRCRPSRCRTCARAQGPARPPEERGAQDRIRARQLARHDP